MGVDGKYHLDADGSPTPEVLEVLEGATAWEGVEITLPAETLDADCCYYYSEADY